MNEPEPTERPDGGRAARALVNWNLAAIGAGFGWFAYIDAPITDAAMWLFVAAVLVLLASLIVALAATETVSPPRRARVRRVSLLLFVAGMTVLLATATATLNLKGTDSDADDTPTAGVSRT
ncbi:MAG: hypothetical protein JSR15_00565 [Proteobacteria bacterium]|nr:hypothetical protein [Pseudomonadota bacterium]